MSQQNQFETLLLRTLVCIFTLSPSYLIWWRRQREQVKFGGGREMNGARGEIYDFYETHFKEVHGEEAEPM